MRMMRAFIGRVTSRRFVNDERGVVAIFVALFSTVAMGCGALAVDLGDAWQEQRQLHTSTDAAALAAGQVYAQGDSGCSSVADAYVSENNAEATTTSCTTGTGAATNSGYVTVEAATTVDFTFAQVIGINSRDLHSSTTAGWGIPSGVTGLRPLAVCQFFPGLAEWLNAPFGPTGPSDPITIPYTKADQGCENAPGNWNLLDYDEGGGGASEVREWFENGYPGEVIIPSLIAPKTGHVSSISSALTSLVESGQTFPIPIFDLVEGNGNNALYHAVAVATVKLLDFKVNGSPSGQYFTFQFVPSIVDGPCCGTGIDTGVRVVSICAVNTDPAEGTCGT